MAGESILKHCFCHDDLSPAYKSATPCCCGCYCLNKLIMHFNGLETPKIAPSLRGPGPDSLRPPESSSQTACQQFFYSALKGRGVSTKLPLPLGDLGPHVTGANMSACPKRHLHCFSHFSRQTHRQTDHATSVVRGHIFALRACNVKKVKVAHTRLPSVGFRN